ncbi:MAG: RNA polymerase sigma factor [Acidobacteria bacterium]|nr:RNA polymerase sigma factor [Acidobacteriota bacterium]
MEPRHVSSPLAPETTDSGRDLVEDAVRGDARAFEELVRRNWPPIIHRMLVAVLGSAADAEDVAQEAFLRAWLSLSAFRGDSLFSTWVYRIALNTARTHLARQSRRRERPLGDILLFHASDAHDDPPAHIELNGVVTSLTDHLAGLPAPYRTAVILRDLRGLTNVEAADLLGIGVRNFKSRLHRGRSALRRHIGAMSAEGSATSAHPPEAAEQGKRAA